MTSAMTPAPMALRTNSVLIVGTAFNGPSTCWRWMPPSNSSSDTASSRSVSDDRQERLNVT